MTLLKESGERWMGVFIDLRNQSCTSRYLFSIIIPVKGVIRDFRMQFQAIEATQINVSCRVAEETRSATSHLLLSGSYFYKWF